MYEIHALDARRYTEKPNAGCQMPDDAKELEFKMLPITLHNMHA
jgi:hypothetical protein